MCERIFLITYGVGVLKIVFFGETNREVVSLDVGFYMVMRVISGSPLFAWILDKCLIV